MGKMITVEGVEGVGKSTNIELIAGLIRESGHEVIITREPGGTSIGERVREILLDKSAEEMSAMTELLLMFASRAQHVEEVIKPALVKGTWVVSDRFTDSSFAYQGGGRKMGADKVAALEDFVLEEFRADETFILDLDVETGLTRAANVAEADRFESEKIEFFERVRSAFLVRAEQRGYHVIDASRSIEEVQADIRSIMLRVLEA